MFSSAVLGLARFARFQYQLFRISALEREIYVEGGGLGGTLKCEVTRLLGGFMWFSVVLRGFVCVLMCLKCVFSDFVWWFFSCTFGVF